MRLPIQFIYTENGIKKDSIAENERMNYVDKLKRDLLKNNLKTKKCRFQKGESNESTGFLFKENAS